MALPEGQPCSECQQQAKFLCPKCGQSSYCSKSCQKRGLRRHRVVCGLQTPVIAVREIVGRGRGLVVTREVTMGQLLLREEAALLLQQDQVSDTLVSSIVSEMGEKERDTFGTLLGKQGDNMVSSPSQKFYNNAINTSGQQFGLFLTIAMVNHSCVPNAVWGSTEKSSELELRMIEDLEPGQEVTVNYIGDQSLLLSTEERQGILKASWGFSCTCLACREDKDEPTQTLLRQLQSRLRSCLCSGDFPRLYQLHSAKQAAVARMIATNTQESLNCAQVQVLLAVFALQSPETVARHLEEWRQLCLKDGLRESHQAWQDLSSSFQQGRPLATEEFFLAERPRQEWTAWIYPKL